MIDVSVVGVHDDGRVDLIGDDLQVALWNHDPGRLRAALAYSGPRCTWKPRYELLYVLGPVGHHLFYLAAPSKRRPCHGVKQGEAEIESNIVLRPVRLPRPTVAARNVPPLRIAARY